jgi:hypothetical protein
MKENIDTLNFLSDSIRTSILDKFMLNSTFHFEFEKSLHDDIILAFSKLSLLPYEIRKGCIDVDFSNTCFYFNEEDFFTRYQNLSQSEDEFKNSNIVIFSFGKNKELICKFSDDNFEESNSFFFNYRNYENLINYLIEKDEFVEYHNKISREFIIVSQHDKKGVIKVGYNSEEIRLHKMPDLSVAIDKLTKNFAQSEFIVFFRDRVFEVLEPKISTKDRFFEMIKSLTIILSNAEKDYQIFLKKFNLENIKSRYKEQRDKYFENLDKNLDTINKQIGAIPLTFSASAFAGYQVKDKPFILLLIMLAYIIYTVLSVKFLSIAKLNISNIKEDKKSESENIEKQSTEIFDEFKNGFEKVDLKIKKLETILKYIKWSLYLLLILFSVFIFIQVFTHQTLKVEKEYKLTL